MTVLRTSKNLIPSQLAIFALASALCVSASAQQAAGSTSTPPSATQPSPNAPGKLSEPPKEGFWGHVNPFARKKWVDRRLEPVKGELNELDEVNAKNARDIKDVDSRAQAGINKAQTTADAANQTATAAGTQAQQANTVAGQATGKVQTLNGTVNGLDQYAEKNTVTIPFRRGSAVLSEDAKKQLDELASNVSGQQGYLLEIEAHAPVAGGAGIQSSDRLAAAVKRYLVTQHDIPVYRMHSVALGNAAVAAAGDTTDTTPVHKSYVELRVMENSLAAKDGSTPRSDSSAIGAARPQ
ncbi:OmpA family protein [Acidicapsa ligni]|uniref:OmpA family protein n=1 Tax=Acidicapsa ligni TaxID=542300 RepID=UPI0021E0BD47|nr:OmpA family protein [Acidicapsa ligni]